MSVTSTLVNQKSIEAGYHLLKATAFSGIKLPKKVKFKASRLSKYWGMYVWPDNILIVNTRIRSVDFMLKVIAHEMIHSAWETNAPCASDHELHDANFKALADVICHEMKWKGGV